MKPAPPPEEQRQSTRTVTEYSEMRFSKPELKPKLYEQSCRCRDGACNSSECPCFGGYCDPDNCLCQCQRRFAGCTCEAGSSQSGRCCTDEAKCPCAREKFICRPSTCKNCQSADPYSCQFSVSKDIKLGIAESTLPNTGYGLFALAPISKGTIVGIYTGEQVDRDHDEA